MPRKPKQAEILPPPTAIEALDATSIEELIKRQVAKQINAAMVQQGQPTEITQEARRQQNMFDQQKHALYFERWGCEVCGAKDRTHWCDSLCMKCYNCRYRRYAALRRDWDKEHPHGETARQIERMTARIDRAAQILGTGRPGRKQFSEGEDEGMAESVQSRSSSRK